MDFPAKLSDGSFLKDLKPGDVIRCKVTLKDGAEPLKRLVVVSSKNNKTILLVTSTSNKFAQTRAFDKDSIYVPTGDEPAFNLPTYIQVHRVIECETNKLMQDYSIKKLDVLPKIDSSLLLRIIAKIKDSMTIEQVYIKRILAENNMA